jgi:hypothetical protein
MMAAAAAVDADAMPALCILALASHEAYPDEAHCGLTRMRSLLQPATVECLRSVQPLCNHGCPAGPSKSPLLRVMLQCSQHTCHMSAVWAAALGEKSGGAHGPTPAAGW